MWFRDEAIIERVIGVFSSVVGLPSGDSGPVANVWKGVQGYS